MSEIIEMAVKAKNFKSIGEFEEGIEAIYPINIIIGKNNVGKSTLLDIIDFTLQPTIEKLHLHNNNEPKIYLEKKLTQREIERTIPNSNGGTIPGNHRQYAARWINSQFKIQLNQNGRMFADITPPVEHGQEYLSHLANNFINQLEGKRFLRINADRDIVPEGVMDVSVLGNGAGATNIIQTFYNDFPRDRDLVTDTILKSLNKICNPDLDFTDIAVRRNLDKKYEIQLRETNKGLIPLSKSGSGLKTVLLVLINIFLMPVFENTKLSNYIFGFEELENNLHPGLQRRLLSFLRALCDATEEGPHFYITTHSNVVIDLFNKDSKAQIIHATHDGNTSKYSKVITFIDNKGILDDLDVRASDLLQSNCIVWVEGPSDRLYFNHWIGIWSNFELKEGTHYQCVVYGGRLLSHLSAFSDEEQTGEGISILKVNKNAVLLMDSDRSSPSQALNQTKNRIIEEMTSNGGITWVTDGREIENYIPVSALNSHYRIDTLRQIDKFTKFEDYLNASISGEGDKYLKSKVIFADKVLQYIKKEDLVTNKEFAQRLDNIFNKIKAWNNMK